MMYRSQSLQNNELLALYGREWDSCTTREVEHSNEDSEGSEGGRAGVGIRSSMSLEDCSQEGAALRRVYFSNQEYYRRLEELKITHLRNMAELEKMYIGKSKVTRDQAGEESHLERETRDVKDQPSVKLDSTGSMPVRRLQRILSDEELNFNDTSSVSDQSEGCREDDYAEPELEDQPRALYKDQTFRVTLTDLRGMPANKLSKNQPGGCLKSQGSQGKLERRDESRVRARVSRVTVPKPFQMMLREEEKKRRQMRTRSEMELENSLLRQELDELRECAKKFRASPAPAHTGLPLYDIISRHRSQRTSQQLSRSGSSNRGGNHSNQVTSANQQGTPPTRPFSFLERERKKREQRIEAELSHLTPKEERRIFKARPVPRSVYSTTQRQQKVQLTTTKTKTHKAPSQSTRLAKGPGEERGDTEGGEDLSLDPETEFYSKREVPPSDRNYWKSQRCPSVKLGATPKKQRELSMEMEVEGRKMKEREWCYIDGYSLYSSLTTSVIQEDLPASKSDYISV